MKKGKTSRLNGFKLCKVSYGTVDSKELKSVYVNIQTWVEPKSEFERTNRVVSNFNREIKQSISNNMDKDFFKPNFILDLDLRHSGILLGKKSFMNLEITLYLNETNIDFKNILLKKNIDSLVKDLYSEIIHNNKYFDFKTSKKEKVLIQ